MYEEENAIKFIRQSTGSTLEQYDDDQILNIIDMVWDWQEANGYLDIDDDDTDDQIDPDEVINYARKMLARDKGATINQEHVAQIVLAELQYEDSLADEL